MATPSSNEWTQVPCTAPGSSTNTGDDDDVHDVSWLEWFLGDVLRVKVPRARCGVLLAADPDRPDPMALGAPMCPRCAELAGYDQDDIDRFHRRMR
jgi:hypothetical protein